MHVARKLPTEPAYDINFQHQLAGIHHKICISLKLEKLSAVLALINAPAIFIKVP